MGDALAASTGRSGGARGRFPGAARAQAAPLHEPERRQAPPFGGMSGGRAFQIGPAHEGGGPGRGNPPDVEVFRLGNSGTIVSLWHFCISFSDAYTEGRGVTAWRRSRPAAQRAPTGGGRGDRRLHVKRSLRVLAFRSRSIVVYLRPCIDPVGASPKVMGPIGLAFSEKTSLYFPLSPYGSI